MQNFHYNKNYFDDSNFFMLYEKILLHDFYRSFGWQNLVSSICVQDSIKSTLHYQTNVIN